MTITPDELNERGYKLKGMFTHAELVPFLQEAMKKKSMVLISFYVVNILLIGIAGFMMTIDFKQPDYSLASRLAHLGYGIALSFLLIPIHEYLHVLAYRYLGAKHTAVKSNWKKLYFIAVADRFVANRKEFAIVALIPFIVINSCLLLAFLSVGGDWVFTILGLLIFHTTACSGDFALLNYFQVNKKIDLVTYDDVNKQVTYFYAIE
jgi:hypothetical protein